jgi:hypothetical protein
VREGVTRDPPCYQGGHVPISGPGLALLSVVKSLVSRRVLVAWARCVVDSAIKNKDLRRITAG